jgi:hypothetical protein
VIDPVPVVAIVKFALVPAQIVVVPVIFAVGLGTTLIVPVALVKPVVLDAVVISFVTLTNVYDNVLVGLFAATLNATPLVTLLTVVFTPPVGKYTIVNVPAPLLDVYVNCPVRPVWIVLPVKLPCGLGLTITTDLLELTTLHVPLTVTKYDPAALIVFVVVYVGDVVVPTNTPPSVNHWYVNGLSPAAVMLMVAVVPSLIVCVATGCAVITAGKLVLIVADPVVVPPPY